jgi:shikimate dehydrogenase
MTDGSDPAAPPASREGNVPRACVIGWPVAHSRSPLIHGYWLDRHGIDGRYERVAVPPEAIGGFLAGFVRSGYAGGNVTVPHKEAAFAAADEIDALGRRLGAVNTLWIEAGKLCATNTDVAGFLGNLDESASGWDERPGPAVVLGAGGAARAVAWGLIERGFAPRLINRTRARAEELAARLGHGATAHDFAEAPGLLADARLLVNTTSLGMTGKDALELDLAPLRPDTVVTDAVYVPLETPLLAAARARGLIGVDGLGMLLHQAVEGFRRWFGVRPTVTPELRRIVLDDIAGGPR